MISMLIFFGNGGPLTSAV